MRIIFQRLFSSNLFIGLWGLFLAFLLLVYIEAPALVQVNKTFLSWFTQHYSSFVNAIAITVSILAKNKIVKYSVLFSITLMAAIRRWDLAAYMIATSWPLLTFARFLKTHLHSARPDWAFIAHMPTLKASYSFPSLHVVGCAVMSAVLFPLIPTQHQRRVFFGLIFLLGLVSWSRLHLTAHWLTDIIGALLLSAAWIHFMHKHFCPKEPVPSWVPRVIVLFWLSTAIFFLEKSYHKEMTAYTPFVMMAQQLDPTRPEVL